MWGFTAVPRCTNETSGVATPRAAEYARDARSQARAAVATGDRAAAVRLLARMGSESSVVEGVELLGLLAR